VRRESIVVAARYNHANAVCSTVSTLSRVVW
jgi:hypothetical protein